MSELTDLGLTSYEAAAYRALLGRGRASAAEVATAGDVPEGRIYDVLNGLVARDLATASGAEPRRYAAVDPETAVDRLLAERRRELRAERERYEDAADAVATELAETVPADARFWAVDVGDADAQAGIREQFERATDRLLSVVGPPYERAPESAVAAEVEAYAALVDCDVTVRLLTTPALADREWADALFKATRATDDFAVRTTPGVGLSFDVVDGRSVFLSVPAPFTEGARAGVAAVDDPQFARRMEDRFRGVWARADPLAVTE